jgi:serine/threonine-protein kinase HipA
MTSDGRATEAYVWIWLPGETEPVVAGLLSEDGKLLAFNYGRSYLQRANAIPIYAPELPLQTGLQRPRPGLAMPSCIRDASPDAWGRRVIINRLFGARRNGIDTDQLDELTYLLESGSDRVGALDFQRSATEYEPREASEATLEELMEAADLVQQGRALAPALERALFHADSIGGARPKALIVQRSRKYIAKFSAESDVFNVVRGEFIAMRLAVRVGLDVAPAQMIKTAGRDVLLVERFDRKPVSGRWTRRLMVSALTILDLDEMEARYASYEDLCVAIRHRFRDPDSTLRELFARLVFNILVGNTDDHARNHAAFWDGKLLALTPAYDICPQSRSGLQASQAMLIAGDERRSQLAACRRAAVNFHLDSAEADALIEAQVQAIRDAWRDVCDEAELGAVERNLMWGRQILNPYAFEDLPGRLAKLGDLRHAR